MKRGVTVLVLLNYHQELIKRKRKRTGKYFKKDQSKEFTIIHCGRCVSIVDNCISGYFCNKRFSKSDEEKCTAFQSMAWALIVHKNTIKNCSTCSLPYSFRSLSLFVSFISFFIKARILLQFLSQAFTTLYMFSPFSFVFMNALITST